MFCLRLSVYCSNTFFPSSHSAYVSILLCLAITQVRIPSVTQLLSQAAMTTTLPSIQPLATTLLADTILLILFTAYTLPCINLY